MKPPSTGTSPAARRAPTSSQVRLQVASMSGSAAVCSSSVTSTARASTHAVCTPCAANAAATMRLLASSPIATIASCGRRRHFAVARQGPHGLHQRREILRQLRDQRRRARSAATSDVATPMCRSSRSLRSFAASSPVAVRGEPRRFDQAIGDLRHRRHDDDRRRRRRAAGELIADDGDHAAHRLGVGDRGAAELHDDVHSSPSRCISSAFRIAAPAAPRMVLWPSATNL